MHSKELPQWQWELPQFGYSSHYEEGLFKWDTEHPGPWRPEMMQNKMMKGEGGSNKTQACTIPLITPDKGLHWWPRDGELETIPDTPLYISSGLLSKCSRKWVFDCFCKLQSLPSSKCPTLFKPLCYIHKFPSKETPPVTSTEVLKQGGSSWGL